MLGEEVGLQSSRVALQCLWVQVSLSQFVAGVFGLFYGFRLKIGDRNGPSVSQCSSFFWEINK